jgi:CBS domain containing-hemolysin-like protein
MTERHFNGILRIKLWNSLKKTGIHYAFVSDEWVFQRVITLNDILEALVEMHQIFYRDNFNW